MYSIGIITSEYSLHNIMRVDTEMRKHCKITYLPYTSMEHLVYLYRENAAYFDALLFSGAFPYNIILEQFGVIQKPATFFSISDRDYYRLIARLAIRRRELDFTRVFIDKPEIEVDFSAVFPPEVMPLVGGEEDLDLPYWETYQSSCDYYKALWESGKVDLIITRYSSMRDFFMENHIRYELLLASKESMLETFRALLMQLSSELVHDAATCVGIFSIPDSEYSAKKQSQLLEQLKVCNRKLGNLFLIYEREKYAEMTTNLSILKELTQHYTACPVCAHLKNALPFTVSIGWGCAESVLSAHQNAQRALRKAAQSKVTNSYIMTSDNIMIGPLTSLQKKAGTEVGAENLAEICSCSGLPFSHISKIVSLIRENDTNSFSASELAGHLNLSPRNASRILNTLEKSGLAYSYDQHLPNRKGRPTKIYRIEFANSPQSPGKKSP